MADLSSFFMKTAFLLSKESKCVSHRVGALIVQDQRITSMGYNGTAPGNKNCCELFPYRDFDKEKHHEWSSLNEVHAEMNALAFAAKNGIRVEGSDMYVTMSPCNYCLKNLVQSGIRNLFYYYKYQKSEMNIRLLEKINVQQLVDEEIEEFVNMNHLNIKP